MTLNDLIWGKLLTILEDGSEVMAMTLVLKDSEGKVKVCGVDDYGCFFTKED